MVDSDSSAASQGKNKLIIPHSEVFKRCFGWKIWNEHSEAVEYFAVCISIVIQN